MKTQRRKKGKSRDIIKENPDIRIQLAKRFKELKLTNRAVCEEASYWGMSIDQGALSRYMNNKPYSSLSHLQLIFLIYRYCIPIFFRVQGYRKLDNAKELGLPKGTMVPVDVQFSNKTAETNLNKIGFTKQ